MENLKAIVNEAMAELEGTLTEGQTEKVAKVVEAAIIRAMLDGQHRAVDTCNEFGEEERDIAHKIATAIRKKNDALIVNLSAFR